MMCAAGERQVRSIQDQEVYVTQTPTRLDSEIYEFQWTRRNAQQQNRLRMIREELARIEQATGFNQDAVETTIVLAQRLPELYLRKSHEERALALRIVSSNCVMTAKNVDPVYRKTFDLVAEGLRSSSWLPVETSVKPRTGLR